MKFTDRVSVGSTKTTAEGYVVATTRVARTGVQHYLASELGDIALEAGFKPNDVVRVYRHADEVFHKDSLASITRIPVTIDHPRESVTADNWAALAVGEVGDAYSVEPEWIVVNPMIKDSAAIQAFKTTHKQISMGYTAEIIKARDGIPADFEQTKIRFNHLAGVNRGRAGEQARFGDSWGIESINDEDFQPGITPKPKEGLMTDSLKTVVLGDKAVQVAISDVAAIEQFKADSIKALADSKSLVDAKDEQIGTLKTELQAAKDAAVIDVDALVVARTELLGKVHALDSSIDPKGKTDAQLRKAAVASKMGDEFVASMSDAEINGSFKALAKDAKPADPVAAVFQKGVKQQDASALNDAQSAYHKRLTRQAA